MNNFGYIVAPYVGAWIETIYMNYEIPEVKSHPTWVRGLKRHTRQIHSRNPESHPTWVRGLKLIFSSLVSTEETSHPTWVRGLKQRHGTNVHIRIESHPTWVRGLKHHLQNALCDSQGRTLRGCVD